MIRKNGFKRPFHKLQVMSWFFMISLFGIFSYMVIPILNQQLQLIVSILYPVNLFLVVLSGYFCTAVDPSDPALKESMQAKILSKPPDYKKYPKICRICKTHVNLDTKHCRECNRCVLHFDHHCKWLNNCIGKKNYRQYSILLICFELHNLIIMITAGFVLNGLINKGVVYDNLNHTVGNKQGRYEVYIAMIVLAEIMSALAGFAMIQLLGFHIFLAFKGITTYEYILSKRKRSDSYKVSAIKIVNDKEVMEEVPLEEVYEPYIDNPQFKGYQDLANNLSIANNQVFPSDSLYSRTSNKDSQSMENINDTTKN